METAALESMALQVRRDIITMTAEAKSGHPGGSLSAADLMTALYFGDILAYDAADPDWEDRDWFILSKGHAAPAFYAVLAHAGYFSPDELPKLRKIDSILQGHPDCRRVPGVEVSTGSLGQGLSISCGIAAGLRIKAKPNTVFCMLGDGECEEGQIWEAAMFAAHQGLDNLVVIVDHNGLQIDGPIESVCNPEDLAEKFRAFGWDVSSVDGHAMATIVRTLSEAKTTRAARPKAIIAETVKGKGVSFMEGEVGWHGKAPTEEQRDRALAELVAETIAEEG